MNRPISFPPPPPLENGDQLTRAEFERRYEAMPGLKKAELIEGVVHMASPVRCEHHGKPNARLITWLGIYETFTEGVSVADNSTVRMDLDNAPQPDAAMYIDPAFGGQVELGDDDYIEGAPEWLGEVAASSVSIDANKKKQVYRRNNVREYLIWRVDDEAIDWFTLRDTQFEKLVPDEQGIYRSEVFPGLWLDAGAMLGGDKKRVYQVLMQGLASPEYQEFIAKLQRKNGKD